MSGAAQVDANVVSLRLLFTDTCYLIDNYQREYAWSQDDVQILIENPRLTGLDRHGGYFRFTDTLIKLANHYAMFLRAAHSVDHKNGAQAIYFNHVNGLNNQMALLLAAVQPGDSVPEARSKASLAANFLDLMFVTRALADEPTDARQFQDVIDDAIPQLRHSRTVAEVSSILAQHLPDSDPFMDVPTFGMREAGRAAPAAVLGQRELQRRAC